MMTDLSHLDKKYFIDIDAYNCPFCNRRHVIYRVLNVVRFHWTPTTPTWAYFVKCSGCERISMHLSKKDPPVQQYGSGTFVFKSELLSGEIDDLFFYSVPTSFFTVDDRIPRTLRELVTEAEGCLKSGFLTGASACIRKVVYELAVHSKAVGTNYDERIKSLKSVYPAVDATFFDTLLTVQQATSDKVHELSYDGWEARHIRVLLAALNETLNAIFVEPAERARRRSEILRLKESLEATKPSGKSISKPPAGDSGT